MANAEVVEEIRSCTSCLRGKPLAEFYKVKKWHRRTCKECDRDTQKNYYLNNPTYRSAQIARTRARYSSEERRVRTLAEKYGVTTEWYQHQLEAQGGVCAICQQPETAIRMGKVRPLAVDHCHKSGRNRKLLCQCCNTMIGLAKEDPQILLAAAEYLKSI
jgi:hypothetical protein